MRAHVRACLRSFCHAPLPQPHSWHIQVTASHLWQRSNALRVRLFLHNCASDATAVEQVLVKDLGHIQFIRPQLQQQRIVSFNVRSVMFMRLSVPLP